MILRYFLSPLPRVFSRFSSRSHSLIVAAVSVSVLMFGCAVKTPAYFEGTWVVTEAIQPGFNTGPVSKDNPILGSSFVYQQDTAHLNQVQCESPQYKKDNLDASDLGILYKISPDALGFDDGHVTQVELTCDNSTQPLGSMLLFQEHTAAYTLLDGTFYRMEKTL